MSIRPVKRVMQSKPTLEGAGVKLHRAFGFGDTKDYDPFLLLDDFRNENPDDYLAGFPWHPHRGIETITYVLAGTVNHGDSLGNSGRLGAGDVQWMTAGSGILHQEMPKGDPQGRMHGFQLWANLPSSLKMTAPRYQDVLAKDIPEVVDDDGTSVRVICGSFWGAIGSGGRRGRRSALPRCVHPAGPSEDAGRGIVTPCVCVRLRRVRARSATHPSRVRSRRNGSEPPATTAGNRSLVLFDSGDEITVQAGDLGIRFLLVSGKPIEEPVAWRGPIVMNTPQELRQAFGELQNGTFIKHG